MEVVGVGCAETGDRAASLRPGSGEFGMGMDDSADLGKLAVEQGMGVEVAGRAEGALDQFAVEIGDDQICRSQACVVDAAWLDDDEGL